MDLFNKKKLQQSEAKLNDLSKQNDSLQSEINRYKSIIQEEHYIKKDLEKFISDLKNEQSELNFNISSSYSELSELNSKIKFMKNELSDLNLEYNIKLLGLHPPSYATSEEYKSELYNNRQKQKSIINTNGVIYDRDSLAIDYSTFLSDKIDGFAGKRRQDAQLTIEMAKEISMLQRNEKGKVARQYFIQLEKEWNSPEKVMARALQIADKTIKKLSENNTLLKKEVEYKENIIIDLVKDIDLTTKRQRINQIIRKNSNNNPSLLANRWGMLYQEFNKKYHVNLKIRLENHKDLYKPKLKNNLDLIDRELKMIPQLYEICCKLFENDVKVLMKEWESTINDN